MEFDRSKVEMRRVEPPQQIKFEKKGEVFAGALLSIEKVRLQDGGIVCRYLLRDMRTGKRWQFIGTRYLDQSINIDDLGYYLEIAYVGDDTTVVRNGRAMKMFEVARSSHPVIPSAVTGQPTSDGTYVSDSDIPF